MTNRMRRFSMPAGDNVAAVPGTVGHAQLQDSPAAPAINGLAQIYALAHQRAVATVENERWNRLLRQLLELDE